MWNYDRLWKTLEEHNMTADDLVKQKILSRTICNHLLNNEPVQLKHIGRLCQYFHCNVDKICDWIPSKTLAE